MQFKLAAAGQSDRGRVRENNEDAYFIDADRHLFLVADGLGGHAGGETASSTVIEVVSAAADRIDGWKSPPQDLQALLTEADAAVRVKAVGDLQNMGTTVVALYLRDEQYWIAHAGDSRAYRLRSGRLECLTKDHTPEMEGGIGLPAPFRSGMITRAIGIGEQTRFDISKGQLLSGDRYLLCSDGLTDAVNDSQISTMLQKVSDPQAAAARLVEAALDAGGPDNITVVIVSLS